MIYKLYFSEINLFFFFYHMLVKYQNKTNLYKNKNDTNIKCNFQLVTQMFLNLTSSYLYIL